MGKIDAGLKFLAEQKKTMLTRLADDSIFEFSSDVGVEPTASVLVEVNGDLSALEAAGLTVRTVAGDVVSGEIELKNIARLGELDDVSRVEVARAMHGELDLALPETGANAVHTGPPGHRGNGVVIGIIDSGIDYLHEAFRRPDMTSRVLAIWDQALVPQGTEASPAGFTYGVEYRKPAIDAALASANPLNVVRHVDLQIPGDGFHGTHVAGIAAGDGSVASATRPGFTFIGVAPEADIIVVANSRGSAAGQRGLGDSADTLDAARYIFDFAASLGRPVVINQSQGDNVGPHDGTSLLERGLDNLLGGAGRAMVKSAGNEGSRNRHASGSVVMGGAQPAQFTMPARTAPVVIDIWYEGPDRFDFSITPPGGAATAAVTPGSTTTVALPGGNSVFVDSDLNDPGNNDNRIFVVISRGTAATLQAGTWTFTLNGTAVTSGQWDAWIQRGEPSPEFLAPRRNPARTISIPGTANEVITAASYVTRGAGVGSISTFSSLGPTRDGRQAPTIAAPGQAIIAPQPSAVGDTYGSMSGTSMAAPMVTGTVALMLQRTPSLTAAQIRDCLVNTARTDAATGATPNNAWGAGKLDADAAFACRPIVSITLLPPCPPTLVPPCRQTLQPPCVLDTLRPPCRRTLRPPCPQPTLEPPCVLDTLRPPCTERTLRPPCRTFAPPCPQPTDRPPCPQPTLEPPCVLDTLRPPCRTAAPPCPQPTLRPPCVPTTLQPPCIERTLQPPCVPQTLRPPCVPQTLRPPCVQTTLGPPCGGFPGGPGPRPRLGFEGTSGGWAADTSWDEMYGHDDVGADPYSSWLMTDEPWSSGWDETGSVSGQPFADQSAAQDEDVGLGAGANSTEFWQGNRGY